MIDVDSHATSTAVNPFIPLGSSTKVVRARSKRLLSIEGGGIRGIIPCMALVALEQQTGKLTRDIFDWVGGTSTGALLAATIAAGVPAAKSLGIYTGSGPSIFHPTNTAERKIELIFRGRQFNNRVLYDAVVSALGANAAMRINDSPIGIMVVAGDMNGDPWYFVKDQLAGLGKKTGAAFLVDAAVASACATTYHDPWLVRGMGYFADGGCVSLADPVYELCREAFAGVECYGDIDPADARVISLGTGFHRPDTMPAPPNDLLANITWVTGSLVGSSKTLAVAAVMGRWPGVLSVFNPAIAAIDEAAVDQIPALLEIGRKQAAEMDWKKILGI